MQEQKTTRLCIVRDLTEHDIVSRIMRKDNFLIGMLNRGVLALHISLPGVRPRFMLTKTLEWNLQWCILDPMFDDAFRICPHFVRNPQALEKRFRHASLHSLPTHCQAVLCSLIKEIKPWMPMQAFLRAPN